MCGRFARKTKPKKLAKKFKVKVPDDTLFDLDAKYNIAPTTLNPIFRVSAQGEEPTMETFKWGLSNFMNPHAVIANARAETISEKPTFSRLFREQRCLVPVDGYYEWVQTGTPKQPYYFFMKDREPFCLAGLWRFEENKEDKKKSFYTFTLITTEPNPMAAKVHDRMPVILDEKDFEFWLDPGNQNVEELKKLLKPFPAAKMDSYPVSTYVSKSSNDGPECIEKIELKKATAKSKTKPAKNPDQTNLNL